MQPSTENSFVKNRRYFYPFTVFFILLLISLAVSAQTYPVNIFQSPLQIPLKLSGTFGELRSNHFHSGIDIRTEGHEGLKVLAAADGYICRIKVSSNGFGKVIYINHPQGYCTVYGHLYCFSNPFDCYIDSAENAQQNFEVELFPDSNRFVVHQGDVIAFSGNSGSSEAPHLHFEIRDQKTEEPINPLLFGIPVSDTLAPLLRNLLFYGFKDSIWSVQAEKGNDIRGNSITFIDADTAGFGFAAIDPDSSSLRGIYSARLFKDDSLIFYYQYKRFNFNESRYVNAHIDYEWYRKVKSKSERCFKLPGDNCSFFKDSGTGMILLKDSASVNLKLEITDFSGNTDSLTAKLARLPEKKIKEKSSAERINYNRIFKYTGENISVIIPPGGLYQDAYFHLSSVKTKNLRLISDVFQIMDAGTVLQKPFTVKKDFQSVPALLRKKIVFEEVSDNGEASVTSLCKDDNGMISASSLTGGKFAFALDTIAPLLTDYYFHSDALSRIKNLALKIEEKLSGLKSYSCLADEQWTLSEWDPRNREIIVPLNSLINGPHNLIVNLTDNCNNSSCFEIIY